jgi:MFS superfamily sulfate permease-like transporter
MAIFRFGGVTKYMSQPLLRGFTTGATYHILIAQFPFVFGIAVKASRDDPRFFKIFKVL